MQLWTIGHSNQALELFLDALTAHEIATVVDVRRFPGSRRHPHFGKDRLAAALEASGVRYVHMPELGGRREPRKDSRNTAIRSDQFRGYADHMETPEFGAAIARVLEDASQRRVALMCAELLWWNCHRGLIADYLKARGHDITHIVSADKHEPHPFTTAARIVDGQLSYEGLLPYP